MKTGKFYTFALVMLSLVFLFACDLLGGSGPTPSQNNDPTNTPRSINTVVPAGGDTTPDPQDDSTGSEDLPNAPITEPSGQDPLDDSSDSEGIPNAPPAEPPPSTGGMVNLLGSAWIQQESDELYEFCGDNKWQISNDGDTVTGAGTFEQTSKTLVMSGDGDPKSYELTWDSAANVLAMKQGETTINLAYDGESSCP